MRRSSGYSIGTAALMVISLCAALVGCSAPASAPSSSPRACDGIAPMLTSDDVLPHAGQAVSVALTPAGCAVDDEWAGELIVRTDDGDARTGSRLEVGESTVSVDLPPHVTGAAMLMLMPDDDCEPVAATADCHFPYVEVRIHP